MRAFGAFPPSAASRARAREGSGRITKNRWHPPRAAIRLVSVAKWPAHLRRPSTATVGIIARDAHGRAPRDEIRPIYPSLRRENVPFRAWDSSRTTAKYPIWGMDNQGVAG
jgi:hypothetical protein